MIGEKITAQLIFIAKHYLRNINCIVGINSLCFHASGMIDSAFGYFELVQEVASSSYGGFEVDMFFDPSIVYWWEHSNHLATTYQLPLHECNAFLVSITCIK